jgi:release factor glutamine methyltransferase
MNALDKIREAREFLESSGIEDAYREAEIIVSHFLGINRLILYRDNPQIPEDIIPMIDELLTRRSKREPLQYILGYTEFSKLKIEVGPGVLIPRPETELLAEQAIKAITSYKIKPPTPPLIKGGTGGFKILDLCSGTGCLALVLAREFLDAQVYGIDKSEIAILYANKNAVLNRINNVTFLRGNLFEPIKNCLKSQISNLEFDLIISNPPYIRRDDIKGLQAEVKDWEPAEALDGGEDGLDYYRTIIPEARIYLKKTGFLLFEVGINQADKVKRLSENAGFQNISLIKDYSGIERIVILKKE